MKKILLLSFVCLCASSFLFAQKVDSIFFHLYTDSLKKGQHNYINVDGKLSNGKWLPMTAKDIQFICSTAVFEGNELIIPFDFKMENVTVKAVLKNNPSISIERIIWIKKKPDDERLPTQEEIMNAPKKQNGKRRN